MNREMKFALVKLITVVNTATATATTAGTFDYIDRGIDRYGFPIVCVIICFAYIYVTNKNYREDFNNLHESHAQEVKALTTALTENTEVIRNIKEYLEDTTWHNSYATHYKNAETQERK